MDVNCGVIIDKGETLDDVGRQIFQKIIDTASGLKTASEVLGYGDDEFVPWHINAWT